MSYGKSFAAIYIYTGSGILSKNHYLTIKEDGLITNIDHLVSEMHSTVFLNGILCAAFSLPETNKPDPDLAFRWMLDLMKNDLETTIPECLKLLFDVPELKTGDKVTLWCIENIDFSTLRLNEFSYIRVVHP